MISLILLLISSTIFGKKCRGCSDYRLCVVHPGSGDAIGFKLLKGCKAIVVSHQSGRDPLHFLANCGLTDLYEI
ncbi:hypothetical protein L6452_33475 [Arctium lappa]|uniref:Uncharacterized protein n=1 Tax=Arctium lappa TaxID=4217 RepID=A0ACB8YET8_ARCLA|nr:hypothetical protein L6452_33475 [Arctium lappa]